MRRPPAWIPIALVLAACSTTPAGPGTDAGSAVDAAVDAASGPGMEATFQQGVDGYTGTRSVGISTYAGLGAPGEWNANGATFADGANDWCTGTQIPPSPYDEVWLLRFDDLVLPAGAHVTEARLSVWAYGNDHDTTLHFDGRYLAADWNVTTDAACAGCSSASVGWRYRDGAGAPWGGLGASGEGSDVVTGSRFVVPETGAFVLGSTPTEYTTHLDPAIVQSWVDGTNHGLRIQGAVDGVHHGYVQPQRDVGAERPASMHPRLTIRYTL